MSKKLPYLPLYIGDWLKDPAVSLCSPSTRGIWVDLLCAMHEADRSGELTGTPDQLAILGRCSTVALTQALAELSSTNAAQVTQRNGRVTVINRRMNREYKTRSGNRLRQQRHRATGRDPPDVTDTSSMSSSFSRSTKNRPVDHRRELSTEEIEVARHRANEVVLKVGKPKCDEDRSLVLKAAILSLHAPFTEHWLYDAAEGVARSTKEKGTRYGYFHRCLDNGAKAIGKRFLVELAKTEIPDALLHKQPAAPLSQRLCTSTTEPA